MTAASAEPPADAAGRRPARTADPRTADPRTADPRTADPRTADPRTTAGRPFDELIAEAAEADVDGWDFSWLDGRATEQRPSWGYLRRMSALMARARVAVDVQTGGGEVLAEVAALAPTTYATEGWPPNLALARRTLQPLGVPVVEAAEDGPLPFPDETFDLVVSRHPNVVGWTEVARVLRPGGVYFSQQIGPGSNRELTEFFLGPQTYGPEREPETARREPPVSSSTSYGPSRWWSRSPTSARWSTSSAR